MESTPWTWVWTSCFWRFPGLGNLCLCSGAWNRISSLCRAVQCPVVSFGVSMDFVWLWAACLLIFRIVFLFCQRINMKCLYGACWLLGGAWSQCKYGDFSVGLVYYCSLGSGVLWWSKVLELTFLHLNFGLDLLQYHQNSSVHTAQKTKPLG